MEQIKRNSTEFKQVKEFIEDESEKPVRKRLVKLYALKPSDDLDEKVLLNEVKENGLVIYDLAYESLRDYFRDKTKKLFREEKGLYYFKSSAVSKWKEVPFEFTCKLKKQLFPLKRVK